MTDSTPVVVDASASTVIDASSIRVDGPEPAPQQTGEKDNADQGLTEEQLLNKPLSDDEAKRVQDAAVLGYYSGEHWISGRRYVFKTITSHDNKKWKAEHAVTLAKTRAAYLRGAEPIALSETELEAICSDANSQRYLAYQMLEVGTELVSHDQAMTHVEKMSPIERSVMLQRANDHAMEYGRLVIRSMRTGLKKS